MIKKEDLDQAIQQLTQELNDIRLQEQEACALLNELILEKHNREEKVPSKAEAEGRAVDYRNHRDRSGKVINKGDKVAFLTKGKFRSTWGIVEDVKDTRIVARDPNGHLITRAPRNTRIVPHSTERVIEHHGGK